MGTFKTSTGERLTKIFIDAMIRKAKKAFCRQRDEDGILYCEACGSTSKRLSCSHIISVNKCQNDGRAEVAFDVDNLQRECIPGCREETERGNISHHTNYRYKKEFIEKYNQGLV